MRLSLVYTYVGIAVVPREVMIGKSGESWSHKSTLNENVAYKRGGALPKNGGPGNNNDESHRLCTGYVYTIHWP